MKQLTVGIRFISAFLALSCSRSAEAETLGLPTLSITVSKRQHIAGEPIIAKLKLANESGQPLPRVFGSNEDFGDTADFAFIVTTGHGAVVFDGRRQGADVIRAVLQTIKPSEFWQCEQMFLPWSNLQKRGEMDQNTPIPLLAAGLYELTSKVLWSLPQKEGVLITSNSVELQIKEPTGIDLEAVKLMQSPEVVGFFEGTRGGKPKAITTLLANYPGSTYAKYARARLILDEEKDIWNTNRSAATVSEKEGLANLISDALNYVQKHKDMPLSDNILLYCARMNRILDRENESIRLLNRLVKDFPQSDAAEPAQAQLQKWTKPFEPGGKPALPTAKRMPVVVYALIGVIVIFVISTIVLLKKKTSSGSK